MDLYQLTRTDPVTGQVEPVPATDRIAAILDTPRPGEVVRSMDAQALYTLIHEAGRDEAHEIILLASGEQVQSLVDFDCWTKDQFEPARLNDWLDTLLSADLDHFGEVLEAMDPDNLILWLRANIAVFIWETEEEVIEIIEDPVSTSPDGMYAIAIPEDDKIGPLVRHLLYKLYAHDQDEARRLLEAVRWELTGETTERAFLGRTARLGDLGFVPFHEALEVFAFVDPVKWRPRALARVRDAKTPLISGLIGKLDPADHLVQVLEERALGDNPSYFARAMAALPQVFDEERMPKVVDAVLAQFRAVANRVHIADLGNPGDTSASRRAAAIADEHISIGLELLARDELAIGARALGVIPLKNLHQVGYSAGAKLARQARMLAERGNLTLTDQRYGLLDAEDASLMRGLQQPRPRRSMDVVDRIDSVRTLEQTAQRVGAIAFQELLFFSMLRVNRAELRALVEKDTCATPLESVSFRMLFATAVLSAIARGEAVVEPIPIADLNKAIRELNAAEDVLETILSAGRAVIEARKPEGLGDVSGTWLPRVALWLTDELEGVKTPIPAEVASAFALVLA